MVGYSRLMEADEAGTLAQQKTHRKELLDPKIAEHHGRIVKTTGDGMLVEFASVVDAVACTVEIQRAISRRNADVPADRRVEFRCGVNIGDVIFEDGEVFGDGVNVATRLEALSEPGGVCISENVHEQIRGKLDLAFEDMGPQQVKNIARSIPAWRWDVRDDAGDGPSLPTLEAAAARAPSIAVLPFVNMSGEADQDYFSDGITEDIITGLSRLRWLFVVARNSSFPYKGKRLDVRRVSRELGVRYLLEGSVRRSGNRIRISVQLVDAASAGHVWAERYDREWTDVFDVQDDITANVVTAMGPEITLAEIQRARHKRSGNLDAWDLYLRALPHLHHITRDATVTAKGLLEQAAEVDPQFVAAYAMLAWCHTMDALFGWSDSGKTSYTTASERARQAIDLDEDDPVAHYVLSVVQEFTGQYEASLASARRAVELGPNDPMARGQLGVTLAMAGRSEEAIAELERALRGSPRDPYRWAWFAAIAHAHFAAAAYEEVIAWERKAMTLRPTWYGCYALMAAAAGQLGRRDEAEWATRELLQLIPRFNLAGVRRNPLFARADDAERLIEGLRRAGLPEH